MASAARRVQLEKERRAAKNAHPSAQDQHPAATAKPDRKFALDEFSPRLAKAEPGDHTGAPLLPPPKPKEDKDGGHEDRFCTAGPTMEGMGAKQQLSGNAEEMTFPELVQRLEAAMGQASLLMNDRLRSLQHRVIGQGAHLTDPQEKELCEIADGIASAAYHVQKWAHALTPKGPAAATNAPSKPSKPSHCADAEEAFASVRFLLPKLMVSAAEAHKGLVNAEKEHGDKVEKKVRQAGVPIEDLRAIAPHLERIIARLGRLVGSVKPAPSLRTFIPDYFAPVLGGPVHGRKLAMRILPFIYEGTPGSGQ